MADCTREDEWGALMRAANAGDEAAYRALLASLASALRTMARRTLTRYGRGTADAEDVVQEVLLAIHLKRRTWDENRPFGPWFSAIARNKLTDCLRRRGNRIEIPIEDFDDILTIEEPTDEFLRQDVTRMLDQLNQRQRDIVRSISLDGMSIHDTAARFGMKEGAVRVALHRGLKALAAIYRRGVH
jgi:RNA polymerase sigma-70 factor (ECF subfamily)